MVPVSEGRIRLVPITNPTGIIKKYLSFAQGANAVLGTDSYDLFAKPLESSGASESAWQIQSPTIGQLQVRQRPTQPLLQSVLAATLLKIH